MKLFDWISSTVNTKANSRDMLNNTVYNSNTLDPDTLTRISTNPIFNKIIRLKVSGALNETMEFDSDDDKVLYNDLISHEVKKAVSYMLCFGRGVLLVFKDGDDLTQPINNKPSDDWKVRAFSGDIVGVSQVELDLKDDRFNKPMMYSIRGNNVHHSRVIDFTYIQPAERLLPQYKYGGISEAEMLYPQLMADEELQKASRNILSKNSSMFYKLDGFKDALSVGKVDNITRYFEMVEDYRGLYGATIVDKDDDVQVVSQELASLKDVDNISLRRLSMFSGIPITVLVGESAQGLNASGSNEMTLFTTTIKNLQSEYILKPLTDICALFGINISFKENQSESAKEKVEYDAIAIASALILSQIGEDAGQYLIDKGIIKIEEDDFEF